MGKKILVVEAHPNDGAAFAGGTIARLIAERNIVHYLTLTNGERGTLDKSYTLENFAETIRLEAKKAAATLGVSDTVFLGYRDLELPYNADVVSKIVGRIRAVKPHIVMCFDPWAPYDPNPDHRAAAFATYDACSFSHLHLYFPDQLESDGLETHYVGEMYFYNSDKPNLDVDVTAYLARMIEALLCYDSQIDLMIDEIRSRLTVSGMDASFFETHSKKEVVEKIVRSRSASFGKGIGILYTEKFRVLPLYLGESFSSTALAKVKDLPKLVDSSA